MNCLLYYSGLSPNHVKHENQDDGYETSAGDVLTPNSHSSSTHSMTPQHQIQHGINLIPPLKCEEQQMKIKQTLQHTASDVVSQQQQSPCNNTQGTMHGMDNTVIQSGEVSRLNVRENLTTDSYSYMDDDIAVTTTASNTNNSGNNRGSNIPQDAQLNCENVKNNDATAESYMGATTNVVSSNVNEIYSIQKQQQQDQNQRKVQHKESHTTNSELCQSMDYNLKIKLPSGNGLSDAEQLEHTVIHQQQLHIPQQSSTPTQFIFTENTGILRPPQKKRGRKKKIQPSADNTLSSSLQLLTGSNECGIPPGVNGELSSK